MNYHLAASIFAVLLCLGCPTADCQDMRPNEVRPENLVGRPVENGAARENRTLDLSLTKGVLYH